MLHNFETGVREAYRVTCLKLVICGVERLDVTALAILDFVKLRGGCGVVRGTRAEFLKRLRRTVLVRLSASPAVARKAVLVYALGLEDCNAFKP